MKIQALKNLNFGGKFRDASYENNNEWKMEYRPYSWEINPKTNDFGMADKASFSVFSHDLPDNEEIFTPLYKDSHSQEYGRASSKDILGTESYYNDIEKNQTRSQVTEMPALNREESLKVKNQKLRKFLEMKDNAMTKIYDLFNDTPYLIDRSRGQFNTYSSDLSNPLLMRNYKINTSNNMMKDEYNKVTAHAANLYDAFSDYYNLRNSYDDVKNIIKNNDEEIALLSHEGKEGNLIDISARFRHYDPNRKLWEALQYVPRAIGKFVALPHKTITVAEILRAIGYKTKCTDVPGDAIKYVDNLIKKRI